MITFLILLAITLPIPWIAKIFWNNSITIPQVGITFLCSSIIIAIVFFTGRAGMTWDTEIWNGSITSKNREHGSYVESYSCNCRSVCSGSGNNRTCSTVCDTCYRDHYTVTWTANSNIGQFTIDHKDWLSRSVYRVPDPQRYSEIQQGDPCSKASSFTNYVKAVPESLFHANPLLAKKYEGKIPEYPKNVYDIYKVDRALSVGVSVPDIAAWNKNISEILRELGPQKQANLIVLFVNSIDSDYQQALESAWIGGKKNDIIVLLGTTQYPKLDWVGVSSWSKSELFKVNLRDDIMNLGEVKREEIIPLIHKHTLKSFERRQMKEFEYLKDEIEPPTWVVVLAAILGVMANIGVVWLFIRAENNRNRWRRRW